MNESMLNVRTAAPEPLISKNGTLSHFLVVVNLNDQILIAPGYVPVARH